MAHVVPRRVDRGADRIRHFCRAAQTPDCRCVRFCGPLPGLGILAVRIGNFINSELWGKITDVPWGFMVNNEVRHATQLYEGVLEGLVLFVILWVYTSKPRPRWRRPDCF